MAMRDSSALRVPHPAPPAHSPRPAATSALPSCVENRRRPSQARHGSMVTAGKIGRAPTQPRPGSGAAREKRRMDEVALRDAALEYHRLPTPGKISVSPTKGLTNQHDLSLAYSPGVAYACLAIATTRARPPRSPRAPIWSRVITQRHGRAGPRQYRPARRQAGDGGQGLPVQEVRRHRRVRHRDRRDRPRQDRRHHRGAGADLRRHQPGGHQGARMLHRRAQAARAHEDPGLPRRPARHRHHRLRRPSSTG